MERVLKTRYAVKRRPKFRDQSDFRVAVAAGLRNAKSIYPRSGAIGSLDIVLAMTIGADRRMSVSRVDCFPVNTRLKPGRDLIVAHAACRNSGLAEVARAGFDNVVRGTMTKDTIRS